MDRDMDTYDMYIAPGRYRETVYNDEETFCLYAKIDEEGYLVSPLYIIDDYGEQHGEDWERWDEVWDLSDGEWEYDEI